MLTTVTTCPSPLVWSKLLKTWGPVRGTAASSTFPAGTARCQHPQPPGWKAGCPCFAAPAAQPCQGKAAAVGCLGFKQLHPAPTFPPEIAWKSLQARILGNPTTPSCSLLPSSAPLICSKRPVFPSYTGPTSRVCLQAPALGLIISGEVREQGFHHARCLLLEGRHLGLSPRCSGRGTTFAGELCLWILASPSQSCTGSSFWEEYGPGLLPGTAHMTCQCLLC